jgi:dTDP-4-amino-4,6-dideoxygalactose transaminase
MSTSEILSAIAPVAQSAPGAFFSRYRDEIVAAMMRVVDSGWYILGREVEAFEEEFAQAFYYSGAVGVASGTDAIVLALRSLGVGYGDLVATVSHTAVATAAAIEMVGALPVFVDIDPETYTMDPESLERTLKACGPIKAVIAVHLYGHPADLGMILHIARAHGARVIEDCAQAHGAKRNGIYAGTEADVATFSFYPTKNLGAVGDGGMVVSADTELLRRVRMLREYGWEKRYISQIPGINSRIDELQAAILRVGLASLKERNQRRAEIAGAYDDGLAETGLTLPVVRPGASHVYHQYAVRHGKRDWLQAELRQAGIGTNIHYPVPIHQQPAYSGRCALDPAGLRVTESAATEVLSLPMYPELSDSEVERVVNTLHSVLKKG